MTTAETTVNALSKYNIQPMPDSVRLGRGGTKFGDLNDLALALKFLQRDKVITFSLMEVLTKYRIKDITPFSVALAQKCKKLGIKSGVAVQHGAVLVFSRV